MHEKDSPADLRWENVPSLGPSTKLRRHQSGSVSEGLRPVRGGVGGELLHPRRIQVLGRVAENNNFD